MTNEEAIDILSYIKTKLDDSASYAEHDVALDMAIKALEQQPCEDAISREALLEELGEEPFNWNDSPEEYQEVRDYQWFRSLVENAPSVTPSYNGVKTELKPRRDLAETSQDCISRERLLARIDEERKHLLDLKMDGAEHIIVHYARRIIEDMPSVTPQQKTGKWIMPVQDDGMSNPIYYQVRCSKCGFDLDPQTWHQELHQYEADRYCPNCGARMEVEECC